MRSSLRGLQDGGHLRIGGGEQSRDLLGQGLVRRHARKLTLPKIEITAREPVEITGIVLFRRHGAL